MFSLHTQKLIFWFMRGGEIVRLKISFLFFILILLQTTTPFALDPIVTEQNIKDAILPGGTFTTKQLTAMDLNNDSHLDVSDLIRFIQRLEVTFSEATSDTDETLGTHNINLEFSNPFTGDIRYTVGGTADSSADSSGDALLDFDPLPGFVTVAHDDRAAISVVTRSDTQFEGDETIAISLLPSQYYELGAIRKHTITVGDNPDNTSADYLFILSAETLGIAGDPTQGAGIRRTLFARKANVSIAFSSHGILSAVLNFTGSTGLNCNGDVTASEASYSGKKLTINFNYSTTSDSFVSDSAIVSFNQASPANAVTKPKTLTHSLTLIVDDFDISERYMPNILLNGTFSLSVSGVFKTATKQFFHGDLLGNIQI